MKRLGLLLLILIVFTGATLPPALRDNVTIKTNMFTIVYSEVLEQPKKVEYFRTA
jgi:hypothetical protein